MKKLNILIVDDIFTNRLLLSELIKTLGHDSFQAENGEEAVDLLNNNDFDLVLMDIEMPVMNGLETTRHIRKDMEWPVNTIPIIALTAHNPFNFFQSYQGAGFDHLITKPYSVDKVTHVITSLNINKNERSDE